MKRLIPYPASPEIERKLTLKHGVDFSEVEELFANDPLIVRGETDRYGERRYTALGQTYEGRYLMAVFTRPKPGRAKVITARDMTDRQYKLYKRKK